MNSATIAAALADIFGTTTPPADEDAIVLATHLIPDELKAAELPALIVWPPTETLSVAMSLDKSLQTYPCVLYLARGTRSTQARTTALYGWRDALRLRLETRHTQLGVDGVAQASTTRVLVNDVADVTFGLVDYDTVRCDVAVKISEGITVVA